MRRREPGGGDATLKLSDALDDMKGAFVARLRSIETKRRVAHAMGSELEATSHIAVLTVRFDPAVLERLHEPAFIAISRYPESLVGRRSYAIYEVVDVKPHHYQLQGLSPAIPYPISEEMLKTIGSSWVSSEETWLEIEAIETGYRMEADNRGVVRFVKARSIPLQGAEAYLLTPRAVEELLCVDNGLDIGVLKGFNVKLRVYPDALIRYHVGVFGFTGVGKSNLTAYLLRKLIQWFKDLRVVIFDVSGEYLVHLVDVVVDLGSKVYTTEDLTTPGELANSQIIPDTLSDRVGADWINKVSEILMSEGRVEMLWLEERYSMTLDDLYKKLLDVFKEGMAGEMQAYQAYNRILSYFTRARVPGSTTLESLISDPEHRRVLEEAMNKVVGSTSDKSRVRNLAKGIVDIIRSGLEEGPVAPGETPETLAQKLLEEDGGRLTILYLPEPERARIVVARMIKRMLYLKKKMGYRTPVLIVLDEAQEFIPRDARGTAQESNAAVEALLRQGRKYKLYAWISTQRVAYLNTNALQQLHSYFVSTLPRLYDRMVIADAFSLDYSILDKTTSLQTGEWLFVSYKATRQKNIPAFIEVGNNEDVVAKWVKERL